jgi:hypothetical protein
MGLTIHYSALDKKAYIQPETARRCVALVEQVAELENWELCKKWEETVDPSQYEKDRDDTHNKPKRKRSNSSRTEAHTTGISVIPHPDSEAVVLAFDLDSGKLAQYVEFGNYKQAYNEFFCKTHYAGFDTHKKVCYLLQAIDRLVPLDVDDEGGFYGVWNEEKGRENFGEYVAYVHSFGKVLKDAFGDNENVQISSSEDVTSGWKT